jgi:hypothetical protein
MEIRQHLRDDADVHGDGWIVLARFRTWVGIPGWRRCRRRGPTLAERGARTASTIPSHTLGGGRTASGRHHPSSGTIR